MYKQKKMNVQIKKRVQNKKKKKRSFLTTELIHKWNWLM